MRKFILLVTVILLSNQSLFSQVPSYVPSNGLVGYWPFSGNANDSSVNGNVGTVNGATLTTDRNGVANSAYSFNGSSSYISVPNNATFNFQNKFTFSYWINPNSLSANELSVILSKQVNYGPDQNGFNSSVEVGSYSNFRVQNGTSNPAFSLSTPNNSILINNWYHVVHVWTGTQGYIYINGLLVSQGTTTATVGNTTAELLIGKPNWSAGNVKVFNGKIDDVGIWNRALTAQEISSIYYQTTSTTCLPDYVPTNGLVGYWPFCGNANDASTNGNNGTVNGASLTTDRNGVANSAYSFNGNSGISIPHSTSLNIASSSTFSFWLKYNSLSNGFNLVFKKGIVGGCPNSGYYFAYDGIPGPAYKCFGYGVPGNCSGISDSSYLDNQWHNIVVVYNLQNSQIYFDGILQDGDANNNINQPIFNTSEPLVIGYYNGPYSGNSWNGLIDDIGIWNRALSPLEISNMYISCTTPAPTGNASQLFCWTPAPTVADLTATGTGIQWYGAATGGTALATTTALVNGTTYYASQTVSACESTARLAVTVALIVPQITATNSTICLGSNLTLQASSSYVPTNTNCNLPSDLLSGLVGYWPFCGNANDISGSGNNGTVNGATLTADRFGNSNNAYSFDGNDFIQKTNFNSIIGANEFTISLWAKQESNNGWILSFGQPSDGNGFHIGTWGLGAYKLYSGFWKDGYLSWPTTTISNQWRHIVITYSNDRIKQYVDNVMVSDQNSNYVTENILTGSLNFGRQLNPYNEFFTGKLDEISIWNRALNATELTKLNRVGTTTYVWSTGETTSQIVVSPIQTTQYWVDITNDGVTCRAFYSVTVNSTTSPTAASTQTFCANQNPTISNLNASGNLIKWYNLSVGGSELNSTILLQNGTTYYASQTVNGCESTTRTAVTIVINPNPSAPSGMPTQVFCNSTPPTLNEFILSGTNIKWYDAAGSLTILPNSTQLINNTTYYASQMINGCESTARFAVTALINDVQINTTNSIICSGSGVQLTASTNLDIVNKNCYLSGSLLNGIVGYWPFCGNATDNSGNGNNGTIFGATLTTDRFGNSNSAYNFDGNDYIQKSNFNPIIGNQDFSLNFWVKQESNNGWIVSFGQPSDGNSFHVGTWYMGNYKLYSGFWKTGYLGWPTHQINNQWRNVSIVYTNDVIKQYVDGVEVSSQNSNYVTENILSGELNFGKQVGSAYNEFLTGKLDDITIWNRPLTTTEISNLSTVGSVSYLWSTGATTATINPSPTSTTTYWCDVTVNGVTCRKSITITVNPNITPTFTQVAAICNGATLAALPTTSTNSITGTWSPALNNTATTTYTFTPTAGQCATTATMTITVNPNITPAFTQVAAICNGATLAALPTTSTNSITGTWSPALNNTATTTYTFTPTAGQCATTATMTITVNPNITPVFTQVAAICNGATLAALPTTSTNSITGTWSPALNNTATTTYTFTPTAGLCATTATMSITVNSIPAAPTGALTQTFCVSPAPTIASLTATGTGIQWYAASSGGTGLATSTTLVNGTTYYASQTLNACESTSRLAVAVTLNDPQITASATAVCSGTPVTLSASTAATVAQNCNLPINLTNGLVGYWPFCGNANDVSGNANNGTVNGATLTTDRFGNANSAYNFDGVSNVITVQDNNILHQNVFSISSWVNGNDFNGFKQILSKNIGSLNNESINLVINNNSNWNLTAQIGGQGYYGTLIKSPNTISQQQWHNIVYLYNETLHTQELYLNGIRVANNTSVDLIQYDNKPLTFGAQLEFNVLQYLFNGKLDDIGFWNRTLSPSEITQLYNSGQPTYLWSTGETTATINPSPTATTTYWCDVTVNGVTCRKTMTITVNPNITPAFTQVAVICNGATLAALPTTSTNSITGTWSPALNNTATTTYTFTPTAGQCATTATMTITVNPNVTPAFTQVAAICNGATLAALPTTSNDGVTGTWSPVLNNTATTTYTFTPTAGQCATTATMTITVNTTSTPTGTATQTFCASPAPTVASLTATGIGIQWYAAANGGTALATTTALVNGTTYYASQTLNACESTTRLAVTVTLNDPQITASATTICSGTPVTLSASTTATAAQNGNLPINLQTGLVGYWPFNGNANDVSGNANNGTVNGATLTTDRFGNANSSYSCVATDGGIIVPTFYPLSNQYTISYWVKYDSQTINTSISDISLSWLNFGEFVLFRELNGTITFGTAGSNGASNNSSINSSTSTNISNWYNIIASRNGTQLLLYVNGTLELTGFNSNINSGIIKTLYFGGDPIQVQSNINARFNGKLDDIAIYNRALSPTEITQLYNSNQATYLWSTGETTATINPTPSSTTTYWCDVTVNGVTCRKTMTITVNPNITPAFTQVAAICNGATLAALPTTSTNSITGTWSPALNNTASTTYTFTPTAGQCATTATMTITVNPNITPAFTQVAAICSGATLAALPTTSTNNISGTWSPVLNNTATTTYTFTPTAGQCATTATMTITVNPNITPAFTQVAAICNGATLAALPTTSTNSITGTWSPALNNTATTTYTFTPTAGQCATTTTMTITVNPNITPVFTQVAAICNGATLAALPTTSTNNISGTWSPVLNNTATTTYTFTPTAGQCATTATMTITVNPNITPAFTQVAAICNGATLAALPTTSTNSITGTWSPALNSTATTTYTFTPTAGQCATTTTMTITVNPNVTPAFTQVAAICNGATLTALPTTSTNNISGTWSPALNNTATTTYTFTPTAGQCATIATMTITVNPNIAPTFSQVATICNGATLAALPTTSTNSITGTWSPALNNSATTTYTFTPTAGQCATTATMTITVNPNITPAFTQVAAICNGATLAALPTTSTNSITGTWSPALNNTATTTYTFTPTAGQCATTATMAITVNTTSTPTGTASQTFCATPAPTVTDLTATGTGVQWYAAANGGTALATTTALVNATTYYATQTLNACESTTRLAVTVTLNDPQITASATTVCSGTPVTLTSNQIIGGQNLINSATKTFSSAWNINWSVQANSIYKLKVSGIYGDGVWSGQNQFLDAAFDFRTLPATTYNSCPVISRWGFSDNCAIRPNIDNYNTNHVYEYTFLNTDGNVNIEFSDCCYGDNSGSLTFELYEIVPNVNILWSTGETTATINPTPTATTTYWCDVTVNGVTCRKTMTITVNPNIAPTFTQVAAICNGATLAALPTTSTNSITGTWSPALNNTATTAYTFTPTAGQCATTATMTITVSPNITPAFSQVAAICNGATLAALPTTSTNSITGTWSPALNNTATTTYTFTPTTGQCATTATMTITVNTTPAPTGTASQTFCATPAPTTADLTATGTGIQWYAVANGGTALATTTALVNGTTYYASQTVSGCVSTTRLAVTVSLNDPQITASATTVCSGTAVNLGIANTSTSLAQFQAANTDLILFHTIGSHSYFYKNLAVTWQQTKAYGDQIGVSMYVINDAAEELSVYNSLPFRGNDGKQYWIGLYQDLTSPNYSEPSGGWKWVDNTPLIYANWYPLEPNNSMNGESFGQFDWDINGIKWNDAGNSSNNNGCACDLAFPIYEFQNQTSYLWSTGETTATINPTPTATTTYWCDVTVNGVTCRKTMTITVNPNIAPTFSQVAAICNGATLAALPTTSTNSITGTWSPALNNTATTTYTFTPTAGQCATTATMTITVNPNIAPTFTQVAAICNGATLAALPTTSTNSITGTWSPALNNTATTTYTFTPNAGQCATTATMTITVNPNIAPTFTQVAPICNGATLSALPTTSTNSITGTWSPALDNTATTTYTFTPTVGLCATTATMTITVNPNITPAFSQVPAICNGATLAALPTTSFNNITGTWSPALNNTATTTYTFTPTAGQCATTATMTITVNPIITPAFTQVAAICSGADLSPLPTSSTNGINGTWSPALNYTATTTYTFTPIARQCATTATMTITVNPNIAPTFTQVTPICAGATLAALPTTSNNGYTGVWSPAMNNTATTTYTFTPTAGLCATTATMTITVNPLPLPPTGTITQTFCANIYPTLQNIVVTPANVNWFSSLTSSTPLPITTNLPVGSTTYYASQFDAVTGCSSNGRLAVLATVLLENTPSTLTDQTFCSTDLKTLADIKTNGLNIVWYSSASGGTPLLGSYVLTSSQSLYAAIYNATTGCESPIRQMIQITIINCQLVANNLLTLNDNSLNDNLKIENIENFPINQIEIYNRFGELVWKTEYYNNDSNTFKGRANVSGVYQKDSDLPTGTYYFLLKYYDSYRGKYTDLKSFLYINNNN